MDYILILKMAICFTIGVYFKPIVLTTYKIIRSICRFISEAIKSDLTTKPQVDATIDITPLTKELIKQACETHDENYAQQKPVYSQPVETRQVVLVPPSQKKKAAIVSPQSRTIQQQRKLVADFLDEKERTLEADKTLASKYGTTVVTLEKYSTDEQMDRWEQIRAICMAKPRTPSKETLLAMSSNQQGQTHPGIAFQQHNLHPVEPHHVETRKVVEK